MALNEQMQQMVQQDIKDAETRPKAEILKEQMDGLKTAGRTARDIGVESIPGVSEALAEKRVDEALQRGDTTGAMIEGAAGLMGAMPMFGDAAAKGLRAATKKFRNVSPLEIGASEAAQEGKFLKNYDKSIVDKIKKESRAATAGTKKADALIDAEVSNGTKVGIRLNLNSTIPNMPRGLDKLQTLHKNNYNGKALSYRSFATVEDVTFNVNQKGRQGIAAKVKGIDVPEAKNKFPAMSVDGRLNNARSVLDELDDEVVEIGFNPVTGHLFTDLATGQAVKGADVATVVGDRVYAKGVTYLKKADAPTPLDATDGTKLSSEVRYRFNEGGAVPMADKKEYSIRQARRDAADFLGVRDATTRATKDARDYSAQTKQDDSYEDTLRHILLGGLIKNVPGQENNMGKTIASKFINTKLMESDGKESEVDINNNKYGSSLRDRLIAAGDSSEEGFIKAAKAAVEQMKLQDFEDKSEGTSPRRSTEGRREVEMKSGGFAKQMELFEPVERGFNEGGLMDEGGMVDKESGNEVPPGSLREEVRDDIPAQLSEGEFVFPADVVRYIGLENLMRMRQEAKQGLAQMEAMGQMGNSEEAVMPDNLPFDMYDLDVEDEEEYNMQQGGYVSPTIPNQQQQMQDPRDRAKAGFVTYMGGRALVADISDLSDLPEDIRNKVQVQPI